MVYPNAQALRPLTQKRALGHASRIFLSTHLIEVQMSKLKTKSSAKKRFRVTATGKIMMKAANKRHLLRHKPQAMKRQAKHPQELSKPDTRLVYRHFMPYA